MRLVLLLVASLSAACASEHRPAPPATPGTTTPPPSTATPVAPTPAPAAAPAGQELPLPDEPWYHVQKEHYDECVDPLAQVPADHFPAPFSTCDPHVESFTSPPGGSELHFHYRDFSVALTKKRRAASPATCCYMIFEFPRRDR